MLVGNYRNNTVQIYLPKVIIILLTSTISFSPEKCLSLQFYSSSQIQVDQILSVLQIQWKNFFDYLYFANNVNLK